MSWIACKAGVRTDTIQVEPEFRWCECTMNYGRHSANSLENRSHEFLLHKPIRMPAKVFEKLDSYIAECVKMKASQFYPASVLERGEREFMQELPPSFALLAPFVTDINLYSTALVYIPPSIGNFRKLKSFTPYTSYNLHYFPYEILHIGKTLADSTISTRALYGNYKNAMPFPKLPEDPLSAPKSLQLLALQKVEPKDSCDVSSMITRGTVECSVCRDLFKPSENGIFQYWTSQCSGTDYVPLLINACSISCINAVPDSRKGYPRRPHKGGNFCYSCHRCEHKYSFESIGCNEENDTGLCSDCSSSRPITIPQAEQSSPANSGCQTF